MKRTKKSHNFISLKEALDETFEKLGQLISKEDGVAGLSTGFPGLDNLTSGLQNSDLIIIAARPGMGKTTLALNIAQEIAVVKGKPVAFFSFELSRAQVAHRLLCSNAEIDSRRLQLGSLSQDEWQQDEWQRISDAACSLAEAPFYIDDTVPLSVTEIRARVRSFKTENGLAAVFVDYLQLVKGQDGDENRQQEISAISHSLKALANELNCPVAVLSQLNRTVETREDKRPILSDLTESGGIEANADVVLFIYRDGYYHNETEKKNIAEIIISKQRNGHTGKADLHFMSHFCKFVDISYSDAK